MQKPVRSAESRSAHSMRVTDETDRAIRDFLKAQKALAGARPQDMREAQHRLAQAKGKLSPRRKRRSSTSFSFRW